MWERPKGKRKRRERERDGVEADGMGGREKGKVDAKRREGEKRDIIKNNV